MLRAALPPLLCLGTPRVPGFPNTLEKILSPRLVKQMRRPLGNLVRPHGLFALTLVAFCLFGSARANATTIDTFTLTHSHDVLSFQLPPNPAGVSVTCLAALSEFCLNVDVNVNGKTDTYAIEFISSLNGGGFIIDPLSGLFQTTVNERSATLFTGPITNPTFKLGPFNLSNVTYTTNQFNENFALTIVQSTVIPTPEPSSLVFLGTGMLGFAGVLRRRFAK